jgi:glutamate 5-kinase
MNTLLNTSKRVVVKIGTDSINPEVIAAIAGQMAEVREKTSGLVLVSSGAVQYGRIDQGVPKKPDETVDDKKFFASIGQPILMAAYADAFRAHGISIAQGLMTWDDFDSRKRRLQLNAVLTRSFHAGKPTIPILNENDVTADDEFTRFTDNDHLAAEVAELIEARFALFLSTTNGLRRDIDDEATRIETVQYGDRSWEQYVQMTSSTNGKGGMRSKCETAARLAEKGIDVVIANAKTERVIPRVLISGESLGTHFVARSA